VETETWVPCMIRGNLLAGMQMRGDAIAMQIVMQPLPPVVPVASAERYTEPRTLDHWADVFECSRNTAGSHFRNGIIKARRIGRLWSVATFELPRAQRGPA